MSLSIDPSQTQAPAYEPPIQTPPETSRTTQPAPSSAPWTDEPPQSNGVDWGSLVADLGSLFGLGSEESSAPGAAMDKNGTSAIVESVKELFQSLGSEAVDWLKAEVFGGDDAQPSRASNASAASSAGPGVAAPSGSETAPSSVQPSSFDERIASLLSPAADGTVHEEELFLALVDERLASLVGPEASQSFRDAVSAGIVAQTRADGYVPYEKVVLQALRQLVQNGAVTQAQADRVYSQAFAGAQLDDNADALFDGRGGAGDPTVATARFEDAVASARERMQAFDDGSQQAPERSLGTAEATGNAAPGAARAGHGKAGAAAGSDGFLWKPQSENDGNLVVLLPTEFHADEIAEVVITGPGGKVLARGRNTSRANGDREHFRFDRAGGDFPDGVSVEVRLEDGSTRRFEIGDSAARNE